MKKTTGQRIKAVINTPEDRSTAEPQLVNCWREIGVSGDRSCSELETYIHCRNCPVMADAAEIFFNRKPPEGYLEEWRHVLETPPEDTDSSGLSVLIFRLANEWFALASESLTEVTPLRKVHAIPHRSNSVFTGMVNVRGQLLLCCSLHGLLGLQQLDSSIMRLTRNNDVAKDNNRTIQTNDDAAILAPERLLVASLIGGRVTRRWTFPVNEVAGVHRVGKEEVREVPSTLGKPGQRFSSALFSWNSRTVSLLVTKQVFDGNHEKIPS